MFDKNIYNGYTKINKIYYSKCLLINIQGEMSMKKERRLTIGRGVKYLPILIILLSISIMIGSTFAYFTDTKDEEGSLTFSKVELSNETTIGINGVLKDVLPGTPITNGPLSFSKSIDSEPIYVRVKVSFSLSEDYKNDSKMIEFLDSIRNSMEFNIETDEQHDAVWSTKQGNYYYLLDFNDNTKLKKIDTIDTYLLSEQVIIPRDLQQIEGNYQYMKSINFHIAFEAIQADNLSNDLDEIKSVFNEVFPGNSNEKMEIQDTVTIFDQNGEILNVLSSNQIANITDLEYTPKNSKDVFLGWYTDEKFGEEFVSIDQMNGDFNLYPRVSVYDPGVFTYSGDSITGYIGNYSDVVIPSSYSIDGTVVRNMSFDQYHDLYTFIRNNTSTIEVVDSDGVTHTCNRRTSLSVLQQYAYPVTADVEVPNYVEGIDYKVTTLGSTMFNSSQIIKSVQIEEGIEVIESAFYCCDNLEYVKLPESLTTLNSAAFRESGIKELFIPKNVNSIEYNSFMQTVNLEKIEVDSANTKYYSQNNCIIERGTNRLIKGSGSIIDIPNGVVTIGEYAFFGDESIKKLTIPSSIQTIEDNAFTSCSHILELKIENGANVTNLPISTFVKLVHVINLTGKTLTLPSNLGLEVVTSLNADFQNKLTNENGLIYFTIGARKYIIGAYNNKQEVTFEDTKDVYGLYTHAFYTLDSITSVQLHSSVKSIGSNALCNCFNLVNVVIGENVTQIGDTAFGNCFNQKNLFIDSSSIISTITSSTSTGWVAAYAKNIYIRKNITSIGSYISSSFTKQEMIYDINGEVWVDGVSTGNQYYKWVKNS